MKANRLAGTGRWQICRRSGRRWEGQGGTERRFSTSLATTPLYGCEARNTTETERSLSHCLVTTPLND